MAVAQLDIRPPTLAAYYPESDGKPMTETDAHRKQMINLLVVLEAHFRTDPQVYVGGNLMIYYVEGDPKASIAPDVFVVRGVPKRNRRVYKMWEEGRAPDVVIELTSRSTRDEDLGSKRWIYAEMGVREYFLFDPLGDYLQPPLRGYSLTGDEYTRIAGDGARILSETLGLELRIVDGWLRLANPTTGELLLTPEELAAEVERLRAELRSLKSGGQAIT
jgi:Uma2 family endonuclease